MCDENKPVEEVKPCDEAKPCCDGKCCEEPKVCDDMKPVINYDQFAAADLRVGTVVEAGLHPNADRLLVLKIDLGSLGVRQILAGIKAYYGPEEMVGKQLIVIVNLEPRKIRGLESCGMVLCAVEGDPATNVVVSAVGKPVAAGSKVQ